MSAWGTPKTRRDVQRIDALAWVAIIAAVLTILALIGHA